MLLRDVAVTLLKATKLIRTEGLVCRMSEGPDELARQMNRLCIAMTHAKRRKDAKRERKALLRQMKPFLRRIGGARQARHRDKTGGKAPAHPLQPKRGCGHHRTRGQDAAANRSRHRAGPRAAHRRTGGAEQKKKKILSVHEPDVQVIVRGKAGKAVEFGKHAAAQ